MDGREIGKLLGLIALADNRKPPEEGDDQKAMIAFWLSMLRDLSYADAAQAVQAHYRESREWIMPADIRKRVKAIRADRLARAELPAPPHELADRPTVYREALRERIQSLADGFKVPPAITGAPRDGEPPEEYVAARKALPDAEPAKPDPQALAREQVAESRKERGEGIWS